MTKLTADVQAERVHEARKLLESHCPHGEIKRQLIASHSVSRATADRLICSAREEILLELRETREWFRARSLATYAGVIRDETASHRDRIRAQHRIDRLLGLEAPIKVAQTDCEGRDISPDEARAVINELARRVMERSERIGEPARLEEYSLSEMDALDAMP